MSKEGMMQRAHDLREGPNVDSRDMAQRELAALQTRAKEFRRNASISETAAIFFQAWMSGGTFRVPMQGGIVEVRPNRPPGPMGEQYAVWNARADALVWAQRMHDEKLQHSRVRA
jgi:hypothetical protein